MNVLIMMDYRTPSSGNFIASLIELANEMRIDGCKMVFMAPYTRGGGINGELGF